MSFGVKQTHQTNIKSRNSCARQSRAHIKRQKREDMHGEPPHRNNKSSYKERIVNALAIVADEGRGKLRKAMGRCTQPMNHRYPNEETHMG